MFSIYDPVSLSAKLASLVMSTQLELFKETKGL